MPTQPRAPCFFVPHLHDPNQRPLVDFLKTTARTYLKPIPKAIVLITPHWEERSPHVSTLSVSRHPSSFLGHGDPATAARVVSVLQDAGFSPETDATRPWDHGVTVPLALLLQQGTDLADIPVVSVSICSSQDGSEHYRMGTALGRLRDEGIAIVGSGLSYHNFAVFRRFFASGGSKKGEVKGKEFEAALVDACGVADGEERGARFAKWENLAGARDAHPVGEADHFMPLVVCAGAGGDVAGRQTLEWDAFGTRQVAFAW
ncbi:hypothetical protein HKX48_008413 [Thoreauomyces humboldtii]|nr:hypothetical protein HKX48_008413 [Thoreauomyces humboldtii]